MLARTAEPLRPRMNDTKPPSSATFSDAPDQAAKSYREILLIRTDSMQIRPVKSLPDVGFDDIQPLTVLGENGEREGCL